MTPPNHELMYRYGTAGVFAEKNAGAVSLVERLAGGLLGYGRVAANKADTDKHRAQAEAMNEMLRELELSKVDQAAQLLRHTPVPRFAPPELPPGWDEGMVRMAAVAAGAGADLAKEAGLGNFAGFAKSIGGALSGLGGKAAGLFGGGASAIKAPSAVGGGLLSKSKGLLGGKAGLGIKGNLALAGAAGGALYLGNKALQKGTQVMGSEAPGPAVYGGGRHGYRLPFGVNQYGQPQVGTPL
jgi:hypothetical protein